ncbi:threonine--tRNA ligase [Desulfothermus okinawensis JCM 13304]
MQIFVNDKSVEVDKGTIIIDALKKYLSKGKLKDIIACKVNGIATDLYCKIDTEGAKLEPISINSKEGLEILRHSTAHLMAQAVKRLFPHVKVAIGPAIEDGFYYDFDVESPFTPEDIEKIEQEMKKLAEQDIKIERKILNKEEAKKLFLEKNETYKLELLEEIEDHTVSVYIQDDFIDLCRGPHVPSTSYIKAFKLLSIAGAYWRGDENNKMLQRIYGTSWPSKKELKKYLNMLEEAKKRDHRKLGVQLDLFSFNDEVGPGMPIFHPKGALVRTILEDFEVKEHLKRGYQLVRGPQLLRKNLWEKSGHYDNYRENMYFTKIDEQEYGLKPMNCLAHMLIYKSKIRSYRDLPIRYFELGKVNRHEKSGVLHGLLRVREFTQDDAHIICRPDQLLDEIVNILQFVQDVMTLFGFEYEVEISTRPEKSIGSDQDWDRATNALKQALEYIGMEYGICPGEGAFYGPKIDIKLKDALNRKWQCATIQCDFTLPARFDLTYIGEDGKKHRPVMLHRVILGAIERFLGVLIEHYAGAFPTWLAPVQARILNITDEQLNYCEKVYNKLRDAGIRVETDFRNEKLNLKIRESQVEKIPYILVIGNREVEEETINVRIRGNKTLGPKKIEEVVELIKQDCIEPFKRGGMSYSFAC